MWRVPWHRVSGSEGLLWNQTLVTMSPPGGGQRHGIRSGTDKEEGVHDDKRSRQARLDITCDLSKLTTAERHFNGRRGARRSTGASDRASSLLRRRTRESAFRFPFATMEFSLVWALVQTSNYEWIERASWIRPLLKSGNSFRKKEVHLRIVVISIQVKLLWGVRRQGTDRFEG